MASIEVQLIELDVVFRIRCRLKTRITISREAGEVFVQPDSQGIWPCYVTAGVFYA